MMQRQLSILILFCPAPQNLLFYYETETSSRPSGIIFLEGCYCERLVSAPACIAPGSPLQTNNNANANKANKEEKLQVRKKFDVERMGEVCQGRR